MTDTLETYLCFSLYSAARAMTKTYQSLLDPLGLTYSQYIVLVSLWDKDDRRVGEIGAQLGLETNTLTPMLKRMEAAGWIHRKRSPEDERQVRVSLTDQGRALRSRAAHIPGEILRATGLSEDEARRLTDEVTRLRDRLLRRPPEAE
jgi:DNA-binding MarR family transcriptional regulator